VKALTVKQPWAGAIALGWKTIENRTWSTGYRGPLAIHAGASIDRDARHDPRMRAALADSPDSPDRMPEFKTGAVVAVVRLVECHQAAPGCCGGTFGNPDAVHWLLAEAVPLRTPVPCPGRLGIWVLPSHLAVTVYRGALAAYPDGAR